ncbi:MAG TPA: pyridoxamine 5'-phosphate oxidase family protein [Candidatus Paceibacterota bacterium]|nr:pyridoxamine 5'-phosphate oxidase family protein [Candidatus Paceibacterota bacterium]
MIDSRKKVLSILDKTHLMSLATNDENGLWVADVIFLYDENLNIYWMSDPNARHSKAITKNNKVAGTITSSTKSKEPNLGIQFTGSAEQLDGIQFELLIKHLAKRNYPRPKLSDAKKILNGDLWYKLTPTKIELIDEENFGYDRQSISL